MSSDSVSSAGTEYCMIASGNPQPIASPSGMNAARSSSRSSAGTSGESAR